MYSLTKHLYVVYLLTFLSFLFQHVLMINHAGILCIVLLLAPTANTWPVGPLIGACTFGQ